ncbi:Serine racemase [Strongyloides ratti]|uniref:L-serine ammonia-lyase n=1 Tax=Strongyloides ratti TaxID=34506 RepID=A0A090LAR4_STRRB|nr:Serine racemase [Strongyloides ratti]CEF66847.1 Serine racemase [Strongyloides ratti]
MVSEKISLNDIIDASKRLGNDIIKTPIIQNDYINKLTGKNLFFKCENFQVTGSFKARGALNAVRKAIENHPIQGFLTHSSGNHGTALAWAASKENKPCIVVIPQNTPQFKRKRIEMFDASLVFADNTIKGREECCNETQKTTGYFVVQPFNAFEVMAGQGTLAIEIDDDVPNCEAVLVAVGGGGLVSGISTYFKEKDSVTAKKRLWEDDGASLNTIADGIRVKVVGEKCFEQVIQYCESDVLTVNDEEIKNAMKIIYEELKIVIEPTGGVTFAGLLKYKDTILKDIKNITLIVCGGNISCIDISKFFSS